jgi:predicted Rossmann fold nucleotide-binding protein DprA/Smf involved in DNA uptake
MKDVQKKLIAISTSLSSLVKQVEKLAAAIEKGSAKAAPAKKAKAAVKKAKAKPAKAKAKPKKKAAKKKAPAAAKAKPAASSAAPTMLDNILGMISRSRKGITVERLKKRTGLQARQVSNALYKLTKKGKIETLSRGVYVKKKK